MSIAQTSNQELARNTVIEGQLSTVLAESMLDDFWTLVPEIMPPGFPDGLATHIEGWLRNVVQRGDQRQNDYIVALCEALTTTGDLRLSPDGTAYRR